MAPTYARNWAPQDADGLAGSVSAANQDLYQSGLANGDRVERLGATWYCWADQPTVDSFSSARPTPRRSRPPATLHAPPRRIPPRPPDPAWSWRLARPCASPILATALSGGQNFVLIRKTLALSTLRVTLDLWG